MIVVTFRLEIPAFIDPDRLQILDVFRRSGEWRSLAEVPLVFNEIGSWNCSCPRNEVDIFVSSPLAVIAGAFDAMDNRELPIVLPCRFVVEKQIFVGHTFNDWGKKLDYFLQIFWVWRFNGFTILVDHIRRADTLDF